MIINADFLNVGFPPQEGNSKAVQKIWEALLAEFDDEVTVLIDAPIDSILGAHFDFNSDAHERVVEAIKAFREGEVRILPGGGGKYGVIELRPGTRELNKDTITLFMH